MPTNNPEMDDTAAETLEAVAEARRRLAEVPASVVVTNHAMGLFELAAIHLSAEPARLSDAQLAIDSLGLLVDGLGERLVWFMLELMDDDTARGDLTELAATGTQFANLGKASALVEFLQTNVIDTIVGALGIPDARLRGALITAELGGIAAVRYVARIEPLASISNEEVARLVGPRVQELLDPRNSL